MANLRAPIPRPHWTSSASSLSLIDWPSLFSLFDLLSIEGFEPPVSLSSSLSVSIRGWLLSRERPTLDPSQEGSKHSPARCLFPSWEGLGVASKRQCARKTKGAFQKRGNAPKVHPARL